MWEAIVANVLSRQYIGHINILEHYHAFALPSHTLHFLLLSLVLLSLLDKYARQKIIYIDFLILTVVGSILLELASHVYKL